MKILTGNQIKEADLFTIQSEPVSSLELMERASENIFRQIRKLFCNQKKFIVFTGKGNNGGDGLVVARLLSQEGREVELVSLYPTYQCSPEYQSNFLKLPPSIKVSEFNNSINVSSDAVIIDAILGTGIKGELKSKELDAIIFINNLNQPTISIDIPSGMKTEYADSKDIIINADYTVTVEYPKLSMILPDSGAAAGEISIARAFLSEKYQNTAETPYHFITKEEIKELLKKRPKFSHKANFGHLLIIAGSKGMGGAAILCAKGASKSGSGLITCQIPEIYETSLITELPNVMTFADPSDHLSSNISEINRFNCIAIGPGIGKKPDTLALLKTTFADYQSPIVIDADAINLIATSPELLKMIPKGSILTPHPGELRRIIGAWVSDYEKIEKTKSLCKLNMINVIIKGAYSCLITPEGDVYFNSTGNSGMAKAGTGDVLTGLLAGLISRGYNPTDAALIAMYYHGKAADDLVVTRGTESFSSVDIADNIRIL